MFVSCLIFLTGLKPHEVICPENGGSQPSGQCSEVMGCFPLCEINIFEVSVLMGFLTFLTNTFCCEIEYKSRSNQAERGEIISSSGIGG